MKIQIQKAKNENDFRIMLETESEITKASLFEHWPLHSGGLIFDRYMFGNGAGDFFEYGNLIFVNEKIIGYALCFFDENSYVARLLPKYENLYGVVILEIEKLFKNYCSIVVNTNDKPLLNALENYHLVGEERFQSALNLSSYREQIVTWDNVKIERLSEKDVMDRAMNSDIPTHEKITDEMYIELMRSPYYQKAIDYVIREKSTNAFIGFVTWWIDENSNTALLEPVACLPQFRRRGIMRKPLLYGLNELKNLEIKIAYVSTSIYNEKSQPLYISVGFEKIGTANRYQRILRS